MWPYNAVDANQVVRVNRDVLDAASHEILTARLNKDGESIARHVSIRHAWPITLATDLLMPRLRVSTRAVPVAETEYVDTGRGGRDEGAEPPVLLDRGTKHITIAMITLRTQRALAAAVRLARHFRPCCFELNGKQQRVVLPGPGPNRLRHQSRLTDGRDHRRGLMGMRPLAHLRRPRPAPTSQK